jgi:hypothetical protein
MILETTMIKQINRKFNNNNLNKCIIGHFSSKFYINF